MIASQDANVFPIEQVCSTCTSCRLQDMCFLQSLTPTELEKVERVVRHRRPMSRGECLYHAGAPFQSIYVVRTGSIKTYTIDVEGREQITGFRMPGELIGLDAVATDVHGSTAEALESASVCEIPYGQLVELAAEVPNLVRQIMRHMSQEILNDEEHLNLLGKKGAEERLAALLVAFAGRFEERGYANDSFNLSMSRADMGSYLGLALETVSRQFSRFQEKGLIDVDRRYVQIHDVESLERIAA